jgi:hypothetical protein
MLQTSAHGDCMAILKVNGRTRCLRLHGCLHASDTLVNLISVSRMTAAGLDCRFTGSHYIISSGGRSCMIGVANLQGGLFFIDLELIPPPTYSVHPFINHPHDVACFMKVPLDANL